MRLLIPGSRPSEVPIESALGRRLDREPMRRHDAVLRFYGLVDPVRAAHAELAPPSQNRQKEQQR